MAQLRRDAPRPAVKSYVAMEPHAMEVGLPELPRVVKIFDCAETKGDGRSRSEQT